MEGKGKETTSAPYRNSVAAQTYLTSVRNEAAFLLVFSFIWLNSPSQIRGIKPASPYDMKNHCYSTNMFKAAATILETTEMFIIYLIFIPPLWIM